MFELLIPGPHDLPGVAESQSENVASLRSCRDVPQDLNDLAFQVVPTIFAIALQDQAALYRHCDRLVQLWL